MINNHFFKVFAGLAVFASLAAAQVYPPSEGDLAVSIPFEFTVEGKAMQAGEYIIHRDLERGVIEVCEDGVYCASVEVDWTKIEGADGNPELIFRETRAGYVLTTVHCDSGESYELPECDQNGNCPRRRVDARKLNIFGGGQGMSISWS